MQRKIWSLLSLLMVGALVLAAGAAPATPVPTNTPLPPTPVPPTPVPPTDTPIPEPTAIPWAAPEGALVSVKADAAPTLDGVADDVAWANAPETVIEVTGGYNNYSSGVTLKSVYSGDMVYYLATWADPTESWLRAPWEKQPDGSWKRLSDPNDKGGDNNVYYEDKLAFIWPINNSIPKFNTVGCFTACHAGENPDVKPYGNKYTAAAGETGDIWHWKSIRNLNQVDDQYLDNTTYSKDTPEAGRHSDLKDSGGYADNFASKPDPNDATKTVADKTKPGFMLPVGSAKDGSPGYILDSEKVPFDDAQFVAGDRIPGIIKSTIVGDRGDIKAGWKWANGAWTLEFGHELVTGSEKDVQFSDLTATYYFGVAVFENAQVRHAFETGATPFVFKP